METTQINRRILAVDDDPLILALYRKLFTEESTTSTSRVDELVEIFPETEVVAHSKDVLYQLTCCSQAEEAVEWVEQSLQHDQPYAIALVDVRLPPGMDGFELGRKLRALDPALQIIFVTAYSDYEVDRVATELGGPVLWFKKPFSQDELFQAVRNCCTSWNQADQLHRLKSSLVAQVMLQTEKLEARIEEMELLQKNAVERELKMEHLKQQLNRYRPWYQLRQQLSIEDELMSQAAHPQSFEVPLLLVSSDLSCIEQWQQQLLECGFIVEVAGDSVQGIAHLEHATVEVVLIDSALGAEACSDLLSTVRETALPLLLVHEEDLHWSSEMAVLHLLPVAHGMDCFRRKMEKLYRYLYSQQDGSVELLADEIISDVESLSRVLLVDDEQKVLDAISELLDGERSSEAYSSDFSLLEELTQSSVVDEHKPQQQFEVDTALQGQDAVNLVMQAEQEDRPFELAVIDMRMPPGIDGVETAAQIRKISPQIEIVILTAYSDHSMEKIQQVLGSEFSYISKPFNPEEMHQRVVEGCAKWRQNRQQKQQRQALFNLAEDMGREIEQRKETQRQLIAANRSKDEFFSSMSHELRTPLTTMIGYTELIAEEERVPDSIRGMAQSGLLAGKTLLQLVNDILDLSKLRSGKFELNHEPFDLQKLLQDVSGLMQVYGSEQGITVYLEIDPALQALLQRQWIGDETRISQILYNLLSNAVKFSTLDGKVFLRLAPAPAMEGMREGEHCFELSVQDHGIGMSAEVSQRIFEPYEQADGSIANRFGGTGLGLFIVRELVELMDGTITVESAEGEGTTFAVRLPLGKTELTVTRGAGGVGRIAIPRLQGKVLLAEDTIQLQRLTVMLINKSGAAVDIANNGVEAIEMGIKGGYQLILMDMQMPHVDGVEATRRLREAGCTTPIVALTANVMHEHRIRFEEAGCREFITKPIKRKQLYEVLEQYLSVATEDGMDVQPDSVIETPLPLEQQDDAADDLTDLLDEEMLREFWDYIVEARVKLDEAWQQGNWEQLKKSAHAVKGMGSSYGQPMMSHYAAKIQDAALTGDREVMKIDFYQLMQLCVRDGDG